VRVLAGRVGQEQTIRQAFRGRAALEEPRMEAQAAVVGRQAPAMRERNQAAAAAAHSEPASAAQVATAKWSSILRER